MLTWWELLEKGAPYSRDYLLPAPSNKNKELSYQVAFAVQTRILAFATYGGQRIFRRAPLYAPQWAKLHANSYSSFELQSIRPRSAEGSERYSRAAKFKITSMKQAVSATFKSAEHDLLAEGDDIDLLGQFLKFWNVQDDSRTFTDVHREVPSETTGTDVILLAGDLLPDDTLDEAAAVKKTLSREKQKSWNRGRSEVLGDDHKKGKDRDTSRAGAWI